jgi:dihydropteroate synthase
VRQPGSHLSPPGTGADSKPAQTLQLHCGRFRLSLEKPLIMGIVNVTPDSFSDGGRFFDPTRALQHARQLVADGADILDIGGESSRPGAAQVTQDEELRRVMPLVEALADLAVPLSVDTVKPGVMRRVLAAGATIINDISALATPGATEAISDSDAAVVLMHMQGDPRTMQSAPHYVDVVAEVKAFLTQRVAAARSHGIPAERIVIDPGFGFGKLLVHNLALLRELATLAELDCPILVGMSRKSMLKGFSTRPMDERLPASIAAALMAVERGARIVRVHDVAETRDVLALWQAVSAAPTLSSSPALS